MRPKIIFEIASTDIDNPRNAGTRALHSCGKTMTGVHWRKKVWGFREMLTTPNVPASCAAFGGMA